MSEERYVDPNSGGAPQPGSYAGPHAAEKGFGPPPVDAAGEGVLEEEVVPSAYVAPGTEGSAELESAEEPEDDEPEDEPDEDPEPEESDEDEPEPEEEPEAKDYSELLAENQPVVLEYIAAHPDEKEAVQAAEAAGQNRKGIADA